jgi:lysyl-tRNA synthetase, class I
VKLKEWFRAMYRLLRGQDQGPRLGTFIHLYGVEETVALLDERIAQAEK